jgi:hypothetical protein
MTHLSNSVLHDLLIFHVALVPNEELAHSFSGVAIDFMQPLLDVVEGFHISHVINYAYAISSPVIGRSDSPKAFLSGSIPLSHRLG